MNKKMLIGLLLLGLLGLAACPADQPAEGTPPPGAGSTGGDTTSDSTSDGGE